MTVGLPPAAWGWPNAALFPRPESHREGIAARRYGDFRVIDLEADVDAALAVQPQFLAAGRRCQIVRQPGYKGAFQVRHVVQPVHFTGDGDVR